MHSAVAQRRPARASRPRARDVVAPRRPQRGQRRGSTTSVSLPASLTVPFGSRAVLGSDPPSECTVRQGPGIQRGAPSRKPKGPGRPRPGRRAKKLAARSCPSLRAPTNLDSRDHPLTRPAERLKLLADPDLGEFFSQTSCPLCRIATWSPRLVGAPARPFTALLSRRIATPYLHVLQTRWRARAGYGPVGVIVFAGGSVFQSTLGVRRIAGPACRRAARAGRRTHRLPAPPSALPLS